MKKSETSEREREGAVLLEGLLSIRIIKLYSHLNAIGYPDLTGASPISLFGKIEICEYDFGFFSICHAVHPFFGGFLFFIFLVFLFLFPSSY
jgi:hypothetical protein